MVIKWGSGGSSGAAYGGRGGKDLVSWYTQKHEALAKGNEALMEQAVEMGAERMKHIIETNGTHRQWARPDAYGRTSSDPGRVASGVMRDAVSSRFTRSRKGNAAGAFGWINGGEDYFKYQEGGFHHVKAQLDVEGMYALRDAKNEVWEWFKNESRKRGR